MFKQLYKKVIALTLILLFAMSSSVSMAGQYTVERYFEEKMGCKVIKNANGDYIVSKGDRYLILNSEELKIDGVKVNIAAPLIHNGYITQNLHDTMKRSAPSLSMYFDSNSKTFKREPHGKLEPVQNVINLYPGEQAEIKFVDNNGVEFFTTDLTAITSPVGYITLNDSIVTAVGFGQEQLQYSYTRDDKNYNAEVIINVATNKGNTNGNFVNGAFVAGFEGTYYLHNSIDSLKNDQIQVIVNNKVSKTIEINDVKTITSVGQIKDDIQFVMDGRFKSFDSTSQLDVTPKTVLGTKVESSLVFNDTYYYISKNDSHIYKYSKDTKTSFDLSTVQAIKFMIVGDNLYFINKEDGNALYKSSLLGPKLEKLVKGPVRSFDINRNLVYFTRNDDKIKMFDMSGAVKDEMETNALAIGKDLNVHNGAVYYINTDTNNLSRMSLDGRFTRVLVSDSSVKRFNTLWSSVVYIDENGKVYKKNIVNLEESAIEIQ